mmetsp:Transcript_615/g.552  ORF Transcript_615/g.552 Transcript_615/m.552 type:complete len:162 (+) Transcript_615:32-517(+)
MSAPSIQQADKLRDERKFNEAIEEYKKLISLNQELGKAYYGLGMAQADVGLKADAINSFNKAIDFDPQNGSSYYNLAWAARDTNRWDDAIKALQRVIELNPNDGFPYGHMCSYYSSANKWKEAVPYFKDLAQRYPKSKEAAKGLVKAAEKVGDSDLIKQAK